eukprot:COSAG01_NODE_23216_length_823_cov_2.878453_2_plen_119_part_00
MLRWGFQQRIILSSAGPQNFQSAPYDDGAERAPERPAPRAPDIALVDLAGEEVRLLPADTSATVAGSQLLHRAALPDWVTNVSCVGEESMRVGNYSLDNVEYMDYVYGASRVLTVFIL